MNSTSRRIVVTACTLAAALAAYAFDPAGKVCFTRVNIWYEMPDRLQSTNFHRGQILPVGSQVRITGFSRGRLQFTAEKLGVAFTITLNPKHTTVSPEEFFNRLFSEQDPTAEGGAFSQFSEKEREHIKAGTVAEGMTKDAVLMAYGYPPDHMTPSREQNMWTYWLDRFRTIKVYFTDGAVSSIVQ